eukprot:5648001-Ditylum_brightwellii.AAC.1
MAKNPYVAPPEDAEAEDIPPDTPAADDTAAYILLESMPMSFEKLERSMKAYMNTSMSMDSAEELTFDALPIVEDTPEEIAGATSTDIVDPINGMLEPPKPKEIVDPAAAVYAIPELASLGRAFRSARPVPLTKAETEYVVSCTKHIFQSHIVLQFSVQNTVDDQRLENVTVLIDDSHSDVFTASGEIPCTSIKYGESQNCFTVLERSADVELVPSQFTCELRFSVVQVDPATGEDEGEAFEDEYPMKDLEISTSDFMAKVTVPDFRKTWETLGNTNEVLE